MSGFILEWYGDIVSAKIEEAIKKSMVCSADMLKEISAQQAPNDEGDLSGNCSVDKSKLDNLEIKVGYSLPYALRQHEELGYKHQKKRKAKYLEDPYNEGKKSYLKNFATEIKKVTKGGKVL